MGYATLGVAVFAFSLAFAVPAQAGTSDAWQGGIWSGTTGWALMNCTQDASCAIVNYGVNIDSSYQVSGWAWSSNVGWACFGASCNGMGLTPEGGTPYANVDPVSGDLHGWADIVNLGPSGWISLNCSDMNAGCSTFKVNADLSTGVVTGFGWNGNVDGSGLGYIDFSPSSVMRREFNCSDGVDNDGDGLIDCADPDCAGKAGPFCTCGAESAAAGTCTDGCDNNGNGLTDCADPGCKGIDPACPATETACAGGNCCANGIDDDHDGLYDCADPDCYGVDGCPADEAHIVTCGGPIPCCSNNVDDDSNGPYDCSDPSCAPVCTGICAYNLPEQKCIFDSQCAPGLHGEAAKCNPTYFPWLQTFLDDIYGQSGIRASNPPPPNQYNATFCLISTNSGQVVNFTSEHCAPISGESYTVPAGPSYATTLGRIDVAGILAGKYGPVTHLIGNQRDLPGSGVLGGRVWVVDGNLTVSSPATLGALDGQDGAGLVLVRGDLHINADVSYAASVPLSKLQSLPSLGWVVLKDASGNGGHVIVDGAVTELAGLVYAEAGFDSGSSADPLTVHGPVISKSFSLGRTYLSPTQGSETVVFDSRSLLNPPPGLADVAKALPSVEPTTPLQ